MGTVLPCLLSVLPLPHLGYMQHLIITLRSFHTYLLDKSPFLFCSEYRTKYSNYFPTRTINSCTHIEVT